MGRGGVGVNVREGVTLRLARVLAVLAICIGWTWPAGAAVGAPQPPHASGRVSSLVRYAYFTTSRFFPIDLLRTSDFPAAFVAFDPGKDLGIVFVGAVEAPSIGADFKVRGVLRRDDGAEAASFAEEFKFNPQANWYPVRRMFAMERLRAAAARKWTLEVFVDDRSVGTFGFEVVADPLWAQRPKKEPVAAAPPPPAPEPKPEPQKAPVAADVPHQVAKATPPPAAPAPAPTPVPSPPAALPPIADGEPPKVAINYPAADTKVEQEQILILALVTDNVEVASVQVSVNGVRAVSEEVAKAARAVPVRARVALQPGENVIEITAIDKAGNASQTVRTVMRTLPAVATPPPPPPPKHGDRWAVVIGVGTYDNAGIPKLRFAERDARSIFEFLTTRGGFKKDNVQLLTDTSPSKPTLINIKRSLGEWLARRAGKDDTVVVYYAGHGAPEVDVSGVEADGLSKYLIPRDADPDSLFTTGFPMDDIQRVFARLQAERVVFMVDTCFSGASGGRTFMRQATRSGHLSTQFLERLTKSRGRVIISAAGPNELALELPELGHGVFTYYLLKGMEGEADRDKDGIITVSELYEYVEDRVSAHARKAGGKQRPIMRGEVEGALPLVEIKRN